MSETFTRREALAVGLGAVASAAVAAPVPKDDDKSWVGKTVMPKKYETRAIYLTVQVIPPPPDGKPVEVPHTLEAASYDVKAEKGTRVEVFDDSVTCWVEKENLVLLANAVDFFTKALKDNAKDTFALVSRGWAYYLLGKPEKALADFDAFLKLVPTGTPTPANVPARWEGLANRGLVLAEQGDFDKALVDLHEAVDGWPQVGIAHVNRGYTYELMGEYEKAARDYRSTTHMLAVNNLAWLRATCPDAKFRDGADAVKLAKLACSATDNREGMYLDTLAAAYAEDRKFVVAVAAQEKALEDKGYVAKYGEDGRKRLKLYKDQKPFRTEPVKK